MSFRFGESCTGSKTRKAPVAAIPEITLSFLAVTENAKTVLAPRGLIPSEDLADLTIADFPNREQDLGQSDWEKYCTLLHARRALHGP